MEGGEENREIFKLSMRMSGFSSDLVKKFMKRSRNQDGEDEEEKEEEEEEEEEEEVDEEIELSLGLSMNGRFGVDPMRKKLKRSSSISNLVFTVGPADNGGGPQARGVELDRYEILSRTRSLPTEAEEEWRRRKEFQSMRRMEARKKRMEKLKNVRVVKDKDVLEDVKTGTGFAEVIRGSINGQRLDNGILLMSENGNEISSSSKGSIGSQRSGSSGICEIEFHPTEGPKQNGEAPPSQDAVEEECASREGVRDVKLTTNHVLKNTMHDMPYVATKVDGPNSHRIEGFLYRYKKGEEVRIVCVCHGLFLTPAEFVKHGGGGDVEHPLKHIVVNPFPLF